MKDLLEAGVHFGHQTKRWNPKMKPYIFGERNGIYIIDLGRTAKLYREAAEFVANIASQGGTRAVRRHQAAGAGRHRRGSPALRHVLREPALARRPADQLHDDSAQPGAPSRARGDDDRRPVRDALEEGNRAAREGAPQAREEPRRHSRHEPPARRGLHRRHPARADRGRRGAQAQDSRRRRRGHQLRPRRSRLRRFRATTTRCGRSGCLRPASPTPSSRAAASPRRPAPSKPPRSRARAAPRRPRSPAQPT